MSCVEKILPGTGRGTATRSGVVEGARPQATHVRRAPSTTGYARGPPPRAGEEL
jgi:hypothetical protein